MVIRTKRLIFLIALFIGVLHLAQDVQALEVGDKAPDFTLSSTTGKEISLEQFRGKQPVLIEFYVADFGAT